LKTLTANGLINSLEILLRPKRKGCWTSAFHKCLMPEVPNLSEFAYPKPAFLNPNYPTTRFLKKKIPRPAIEVFQEVAFSCKPHLKPKSNIIVLLYLFLILSLYFFKMFYQFQLIQLFKANTVNPSTRLKSSTTRQLRNTALS